MHVSPFTQSFQKAVRFYVRSFESQNSVNKICHLLCSSKYSTSKQSENSEKKVTQEAEENLKDSDLFGSLQKPLESFAQTEFAKPYYASTKRKNVRIVNFKNRPRYDKSNDPNVFGNLSNANPVWYSDVEDDPQVDNDLSDDSTLVRNISVKYRSPSFYLERMKQLVSEKKLKEALDLFVDMRRNLVHPQHPHFTFMIGACGRFGYTDMAFKLLRQMTDRAVTPSSATLTGLFNACGESPFTEYGLSKARLLREKIAEKGWPLNQITYHSMIKAFGKCGDIQTAFQIVDEMEKAEVKVDVVTYSFLLMSCVANKDAGFTHAIEVWRKMKERRCQPNLFSFNLLLRTVRECDVGPEEVSCLLLQHWSSYSKRPYGFKTKDSLPRENVLTLQDVIVNTINTAEQTTELLPEGNVSGEDVKIQEDDAATGSVVKRNKNALADRVKIQAPSILNARPVSCAEVVELGQIKTPIDRLALLGGAEAFLLDMKKAKVKPNVKTFTLLLESLPPSTEAEQQLLSLLSVYSVKPDVGFFNMLIKRRNIRSDYAAAHQVLCLINEWSLSPDIITFGVLALGCTTYGKATVFVNDMRKLGYTPSIETIGALLHNACRIMDFKYIESTLHLMEDQGIEPNDRILKKIEDTLELARNNIIDMEHGKDVPPLYQNRNFPEKYRDFCEVYEKWLKNIGFEKPEHVWDQFRTEIVEKSSKVDVMPLNSEIVQ